MSLKKQDREFNFNKITYLEYKFSEIDRTLLNLFPRLKFDGYLGKVRKGKLQLNLELFRDELIDPKNQDEFINFQNYPEIISKWLETDLLDIVNRGRPTQAVASPRPLHGNTYKYRNPYHCRDYGTSEQIFWMLYYSHKGQAVLDALKDFIFTGLDPNTDQIDYSNTKIDVETQVILHFDKKVNITDQKDTRNEPDRFAPLCLEQCDLLADDILRLLTYENYMPRSVLVDYLKTLLSFHLSLYHLRLLKLVPELLKRPRETNNCFQCPNIRKAQGNFESKCVYQLGLVVDLGDRNNPQIRNLARASADYYYRLIPLYIQAHFTFKKLDEMASYLKTRGQFLPSEKDFSLKEISELLTDNWRQERENFFSARLSQLIENFTQGKDHSLPPEITKILEMKLNDFETYLEILVALRGQYNRKYITQSLDSLMLKNKDTGLLAQPHHHPRYFVLGSRLLEVLLQIAVLEPQGTTFTTCEIRIDALLEFLRKRYGLYIDRLPPDNGFLEPSIKDRISLRQNVETFKTRLREIGFFQDLSDAYVTQTVTPRYTINHS